MPAHWSPHEYISVRLPEVDRQLATISAPTAAIDCGLNGSAKLLPSTEADSFINARLLRGVSSPGGSPDRRPGNLRFHANKLKRLRGADGAAWTG